MFESEDFVLDDNDEEFLGIIESGIKASSAVKRPRVEKSAPARDDDVGRNEFEARRPTTLDGESPPRKRFDSNRRGPIEPRSAPRTIIVRKFPGPAGLLPDVPHPERAGHEERSNFCRRVDDREASLASSEHNLEYLSQATETLFYSGAWRLMLEYLPTDFLKGREIATIKRKAKNNSRVSFMAGVVHRIERRYENPRLVLKDRSDTVEGTIHRDIIRDHPNVVEPGVVLLLRNVGILGFRALPNFPSLRFHVMIAPANVVAIFSDKSRLLSSPWMNSLGSDRLVEVPCDDVATKENVAPVARPIESANVVPPLPDTSGLFSDPRKNSLGGDRLVEGPRDPVATEEIVETAVSADKTITNRSMMGLFGDHATFDDQDDSEDELLSQLDVDSIVGAS